MLILFFKGLVLITVWNNSTRVCMWWYVGQINFPRPWSRPTQHTFHYAADFSYFYFLILFVASAPPPNHHTFYSESCDISQTQKETIGTKRRGDNERVWWGRRQISERWQSPRKLLVSLLARPETRKNNTRHTLFSLWTGSKTCVFTFVVMKQRGNSRPGSDPTSA